MAVDAPLKHVVVTCSSCGQQHEFLLEVRPKLAGTVLFGGADDAGLVVDCPVSGQPITIVPRIPEGLEVIAVRSPGQQDAPSADARTDSQRDYEKWISDSRSTGLDFAKTLMTTSAGSIAIYFTILKFLGSETWTGPGWAGIAPPLLFLAAVIVFAIALRPQLATVTAAGFEEYRANRLARLNRLVTAGLMLFIVGVAASVIAFALATIGPPA